MLPFLMYLCTVYVPIKPLGTESAPPFIYREGMRTSPSLLNSPQIQSTAEYIINKRFLYLFVSPRAAGQSYLSGACQLIHIIS